MKFALLLALEQFADSRIPSSRGVLADADSFRATLLGLGYDEANVLLLADQTATLTLVRSRIKSFLKQIANEDQLLVVIWSRRQTDEFDRQFIICFDSLLDDLEETALPFDFLSKQLQNIDAQSITAIMAVPNAQTNTSILNADRLDGLLETSVPTAVLWAGLNDEELHYLPQKKQTAFGYHLNEIFQGRGVEMSHNNSHLTAQSLFAGLRASIEKSLTNAFAMPEQQSLELRGTHSERLAIVDLAEFIERRNAQTQESLQHQSAGLSFRGERRGTVKSLSGFTSSHRVPTEVSERTQAFVAQLAEKDLVAELEYMHRRLRDELKLKRKDLEIIPPAQGVGSIVSQGFAYTVSIGLAEDQPGELIWFYELSDLKDLTLIRSRGMGRAFEERFTSLRFSPPREIKIADVVDRIETLDNDKIRLDYDINLTGCQLQIPGFQARIEITPWEIACVFLKSQSPTKLLQAFAQLKSIMGETLGVNEKRIS